MNFATFAVMLLLLCMVNMFIALVWVMAWHEFEDTALGQMFLEWLKKKMKRKKE